MQSAGLPVARWALRLVNLRSVLSTKEESLVKTGWGEYQVHIGSILPTKYSDDYMCTCLSDRWE